MAQRARDAEQYSWWGNYGISALIFSVEHCLAGRKAKSKYMEKPIYQMLDDKKAENSEENLQKQREMFMQKLLIMQANYEISHPKKKKQETQEGTV